MRIDLLYVDTNQSHVRYFELPRYLEQLEKQLSFIIFNNWHIS